MDVCVATGIESQMCRVNKLSFCEDLAAEYSSSGLSINQRTCKNTLCNECDAPAGRANRVVVTDCGSWYAAAFAVRGRPADWLAKSPLRPPSPARWTVTADSF